MDLLYHRNAFRWAQKVRDDMKQSKWLLVFIIFSLQAAEPERVTWEKKPIALTLQVGAERIVHFPKPGAVKVGVPETLDETLLRTQILDNTVYWLAKEPFEGERIQVMNSVTGEIYLFDVSAKPQGDVTPIEIISGQRPQSPLKGETNKGKFDYVALTRFAAQQMYAPKRIVKDQPGFIKLPVPTQTQIPLVRGGKIEALPLISWRTDGGIVTVVRLKNLTTEAVVLDPRQLRGEWLAATFQHARLLPKGQEADTTCVYLISAKSFEKAMSPFL